MKDKKRRFVVNLEWVALIDHTVCECLSEVPVHLCLDTVNDFDDKTVETTALELWTDGEKKWKSSRTQVHEQRTKEGGREERIMRTRRNDGREKFKPDKAGKKKKKKDVFFAQLYRSQTHSRTFIGASYLGDRLWWSEAESLLQETSWKTGRKERKKKSVENKQISSIKYTLHVVILGRTGSAK